MMIVKLYVLKGEVKRVAYGTTPDVELPLADNERIVSFEIKPTVLLNRARMTQDWDWTAVIQRDVRRTR